MMRLAPPPASRIQAREALLEAGGLLCLLVEGSAKLAGGKHSGITDQEVLAAALIVGLSEGAAKPSQEVWFKIWTPARPPPLVRRIGGGAG